MAKLKYTPEIKKQYVQRYVDEKWSSRNKFAKANNLFQSVFNKWCQEYEGILSKKHLFAPVRVIEDNSSVIRTLNGNQESRVLNFSFSYGELININIKLPSKSLKKFFGGTSEEH